MSPRSKAWVWVSLELALMAAALMLLRVLFDAGFKKLALLAVIAFIVWVWRSSNVEAVRRQGEGSHD